MVGQAKLHKKVVIIAAGNKTSDKAVTHKMSTALQNRMIHFNLEVSQKDWLNWAAKNDIDYRILAYIGFKPAALFNFDPNHNDSTFASPRSWHFLSKLIKNEPNLTHDILPLITGAISEASGREFNAYCQVFEDLPTFKAILSNPDMAVPTEPSILYAVSSMIAYNVDKDNIDTVMPYIFRLPIEFQVILLQQTLKRDVSLLQTKAVKEWMRDRSEILFD